MIQLVISRMAQNSFLLKGWSVTLVAALFALAVKDGSQKYVILALFPALTFWGLDAYYLRQERLFRKLYDAVRESTPEMPITVEPFSMDTSRYNDKVASWWGVLVSRTIIAFHGIIVVVILFVAIAAPQAAQSIGGK